MAKVQVVKGGITLTVDETAIDYYLRTGYKRRKAPKPAIIKVQIAEIVPPQQDEEIAPVEPAAKSKRKTRKKKSE